MRAMPNGLNAVATYTAGEPEKPAVLFVHGFLQTRHFPTVARLGASLRENGYTVLQPILTLRVPERKQSLSCDAVHTHRMDESVSEIVAWVEMLREQGHDQVVLFGHSYGGVQAVAAALRIPDLTGVVGISLADAAHTFGGGNGGNLAERVRDQARAHPGKVRTYRLSHCPKYATPPAAYLSYVKWDRQRILKAVEALDTPVFVIVGDADERMGTDWPSALRLAGARVQRVPGANHFFSAMHEFDLVDEALSVLEMIEATPR